MTEIKPYNTPTGRCCYWLRKVDRLQADPMRTAARVRLTKAGARWAYEVALQRAGETALRRALSAAGLDLPAWIAPDSIRSAGARPEALQAAQAAK